MALRHVAKELKFPFSLICKENEAEQFKAQTKQSQMLDVIYKSALTLCAHLFFSLCCGQTTSDDAYAQMIKVRASSVSDVKERWTYLCLFLQTVVLCGTVSEAQSVARN